MFLFHETFDCWVVRPSLENDRKSRVKGVIFVSFKVVFYMLLTTAKNEANLAIANIADFFDEDYERRQFRTHLTICFRTDVRTKGLDGSIMQHQPCPCESVDPRAGKSTFFTKKIDITKTVEIPSIIQQRT